MKKSFWNYVLFFSDIYHLLFDETLGILIWVIVIVGIYYQGLCWGRRGMKEIGMLTRIFALLELGKGVMIKLDYVAPMQLKGKIILWHLTSLFLTIPIIPQTVVLIILLKNILPFYITTFDKTNNRRINWKNLLIFFIIIFLIGNIILINSHDLVGSWYFSIYYERHLHEMRSKFPEVYQ